MADALSPSVPPPAAPVALHRSFSRRLFLIPRVASTASGRSTGSRTSVQGDLIKSGLNFAVFGPYRRHAIRGFLSS